MPIITFDGHDYDCHQGETILESLTRHGVLLPSACGQGVCQTCMTKAVKGKPPVESQKGLKDTLAAQGYFLTCICKPEEDMELAVADVSKAWVKTTVLEKTLLNESVMRMRLQCEETFDYFAGQFTNLKHPETELVRSYLLASLPDDGALELHIKRVPDGQMSGYLHDDVQVGDSFSIDGPVGDCFYTDKDLDQSLLMVGVGTGLAPLYGIVRDALQHGHRGDIHLFHASLAKQGLYYEDELNALVQHYKNVHYIPCVLHGEVPQGGQQGEIQQLVQAAVPQLAGWRVFVCGDPQIVNGLKQTCFMAGASMADIYTDPFV